MRRRLLAACLAGLAVLTLGGCLRQSAYYYIQPDNTVDGTIYIALDEAYTNASDPYRGTGAGDIAAFFDHATVTAFDNGKWKGYHVDFVDEPLATFSEAVTDTWGVQILKDSNNEYVINGYAPTASDASARQTILDDDGFMQLTVSFPGSLIQQTEAKETSAPGETPGWAAWDMLNVTNAPTARGKGGLLFHLVPGVGSLFLPSGDPVPNPTTSAAPAAPQPVVTVVVTPNAAPNASSSSNTGANPSPSSTPIAAPPEETGARTPAWVWIVGAALLVALAGLTGALVATRRGAITLPVPPLAPDPLATGTPVTGTPVTGTPVTGTPVTAAPIAQAPKTPKVAPSDEEGEPAGS